MPGFPGHHQLLEPTQTHVHRVSDAIRWSHPLSSPSPPTFNLSQHKSLFQWVSSSHQVAKVLELLFSISPSKEYSGLISFRMDWLHLLAVQETHKSLLQHHSSKASFFGAQLSLQSNSQHPCMTAGKTIALTRWTFVSKVMSLLFNIDLYQQGRLKWHLIVIFKKFLFCCHEIHITSNLPSYSFLKCVVMLNTLTFVVQPSLPPIPRTPFFLQNWNSIPIKH